MLLAALVTVLATTLAQTAWSQDAIGNAGPRDSPELQPRRVLWVSSLYPEHSFWSEHLRFSFAAARDLGFNLEPVFLYQNQATYRGLLSDLAGDTRYDGAILPSMKNQGSFVVEQIRSLGIPTVSNVVPMDFKTVGQPEPGSSWVAELRPDELGNGANLLRHLVRSARLRQLVDDQEPVEVVAIAGSRTDSVGQARLRGLLQAAQADAGVSIKQVFHSENWSRAQSRRIMATALKRYPNAKVIWGANDDIAIGALAAIRDAGRNPAREFAVGGIDAIPEMLDAIKKGDGSVTIAGLSLHGAWSLVLLHEHLRGRSYATGNGATVIGSDIVDRDNVDSYIDLFNADADDLDFKAIAEATARTGSTSALSLQTLFTQRASAQDTTDKDP